MYMDESVLGWRPLAEAWLANRSPQESHVSRHLRSALYRSRRGKKWVKRKYVNLS